jgi:NACalpha-BTF3-like transcription factor
MLGLMDALEDLTELPPTLLPMIPIRLFLLAGQSAVDGCIGDLSPKALRRIVAPEFGIEAQSLYDALTSDDHGFLERRDDGLHLHDWHDHAGQAFARRAEWRDRKAATTTKRQAARDRKRAQRQRVTSAGQSCDIAGTKLDTCEKEPVLSHPKSDVFANENNDFEYSSGKLGEFRENPPLKGKGKVKDKSKPKPDPYQTHSTELDNTPRARNERHGSGVGFGMDTPMATVTPIDRARRNPSEAIPDASAVADALDDAETALCSPTEHAEVEPNAQAPMTPPTSPERNPTPIDAPSSIADTVAVVLANAKGGSEKPTGKTQSHNECSVSGEGGVNPTAQSFSPLPPLDSRHPTERLTIREVQQYVVQRRAAYASVGLGRDMLAECRQQQPTVATLREALAAAPRTTGPSIDRYMAKVLERHRVEGRVPEPPASEVIVTVPAEQSLVRPPSAEQERNRRREAWAKAFAEHGYTRDDARIAERAEEGALEAEDIALIAQGNGDWVEYDKARAAVREEGQRQYAEAMARLLCEAS